MTEGRMLQPGHVTKGHGESLVQHPCRTESHSVGYLNTEQTPNLLLAAVNVHLLDYVPSSQIWQVTRYCINLCNLLIMHGRNIAQTTLTCLTISTCLAALLSRAQSSRVCVFHTGRRQSNVFWPMARVNITIYLPYEHRASEIICLSSTSSSKPREHTWTQASQIPRVNCSNSPKDIMIEIFNQMMLPSE